MKELLFIIVIGLSSLTSKAAIAFWPAYDNHQGVKKYQENDYENAINHFDSAIKNSPDGAEYHYNQGNAQYRLNHYEAAEKEFLLSLNARDEEIRIKSLYNLGNVKFKENDLKSALDYYEKALQIKPDYKEAELNRDFVKKQIENQKKQDQDSQNKDKQNPQQEQQNNEDQKDKDKQSPDQKQPEEPSASTQKNNPEPDKQDQTGKPENNDQSAKGEMDKKEGQGEPENISNKDETSLKERQLYRILESIEDDPTKALKESVIKEGKPNRKKIERPW